MQITISGDIGSGKSTVGNYLAKKLNAELIDCGQLYRDYAATKGFDVLQQNIHGKNTIDKMIDARIEELGRGDKSRVYVSRTAWHFIPNAVHIYLSVNPVTAAKRILLRKSNNEEHSSLEDVLHYNEKRIMTEDARYEKMYGITREQQLKSANIIMCIGNRSIDEVCEALYDVLLCALKRVLIMDTKIVVPTQVIQDINMDVVNDYRTTFVNPDWVHSSILVDFCNGVPFVQDGHHRLCAANLDEKKFIVTPNFCIVNEERDMLTKSQYYDWEDMLKSDMSTVTTDMSTLCPKELKWCRENAPSALRDMSDEELLKQMHKIYIQHLSVHDC